MPARGAIVSLLPAATEIVCALGEGNRLSGVSHVCDYPERVQRLAKITSSHVDPDGSSAQIFMDVERLIAQGLPLFDVDPAALRRAAPEVILTQTQFEIRAATPQDLERALTRSLTAPPEIVSMKGLTLAGILEDILAIGRAIDAAEKAKALVEQLQGHFNEVRELAQARDAHPKVGVLEWSEPLMGAGNWLPELIELAGGVPAWGEAGAHSPWITVEEIAAADPDILLLVPCGHKLETVRGEAKSLMGRADWHKLRAVREGNFYCADGNHYFNRPGPRIRESLDILFSILGALGEDECGETGKWERVNSD